MSFDTINLNMDALRTPAAVAAALVTGLTIANSLLAPPRTRVLRSPLYTKLPTMTPEEIEDLAYPPDAFPGARDVETPHGSIRVYEWGPEDGPRVLFIHGISTPCLVFRKVVHPLVEAGYRVMLFDLFGRGYTDGVNDLPHDAALYVTEAMYALLSSPLSWTGHGQLNVVGYSLGGGIATHFAGTFPGLVKKLVLLAPAGLVRAQIFGGAARAVFRGGWMPEGLLAFIARKRLQTPLAASIKNRKVVPEKPSEVIEKAAAAEVTHSGDDDAEAFEVRMRKYISWMVQYHSGFVPSFLSCLRNGPLLGQEEAYAKLGKREKGTTTILLGKDDELIVSGLFMQDFGKLVTGDNVEIKEVPGSHDFVITHAPLVVEELKKALS